MAVALANNTLPINSRLEEYVIQSVLGVGGFGITYLARDTRLGLLVAIKEYFPQAYAIRDSSKTIHPNTGGDTGDAENYKWGLQEFLKEARALAQFKHTNIVRVLRFLEANGTAYMAMEYEEGESLSDVLRRHEGYLAEPLLLNVFLPVLNGLQAVHDAGLLHLDIKPDNIYLRRNGVPMLIDFGSARQRSTANRSQKVALTPGYAALEQYPGHGDIGPWSDVYSLGATLYRCITGKEPLDAMERERGMRKLHIDPLIPAMRFERPLYSAHIRGCVDAALHLQAAERPTSAFALQNGLIGKDMTQARAAAVAPLSRGAGFIGVADAPLVEKRRRIIPRGPLEKLLVFSVFSAVLLLVTVRILHFTGDLSEGQEYDYMDQLVHLTTDYARASTRFLEENLLGVKRAPEYVPPPQTAVRVALPKPVELKPVAVYEVSKILAATVNLPAAVESMTFVKNGAQVALALENGSVQLRNTLDGKLTRTFVAASAVPGVVAASADGQRLAFSDGSSIQVWDLEKNTFLGEFTGHDDAILALAFSPDGKHLASAGRDQMAFLWDVNSGELLQDLSKPASEPLGLTFSPDGNRLAVADSAGGIRYWEISSLHDIAYVPTRDLPLSALAYSPDGKWFAVGGEQGFLSLWDVTGKIKDRILNDVPDTIHQICFSPDSKWLIVAGSDGSLQLWDVEEAKLLQTYAGANHQNYALALSADGKLLAAGGIDAKLTIWQDGH